MVDVYENLARFVDNLPGGFPRSETGVELRILRKLFSQEEAGLFQHLTLLTEPPAVIARRAGLPVDQTAAMLAEMERKGLIYGTHKPGHGDEYMAQQFVIGFWEGQVNKLDRELVELFEEYLPILWNPEVWRKAPQLRTIPIGESLPTAAGAMPYEDAGQIICSQATIAVMNCICRQEMHLIDAGCDRPLETCLTFGSAAHQTAYSGKGRLISQEEALEILRRADQAGLVLQPGNSKQPMNICACCGDCCGVLRSLKRHPHPADIASSPYRAAYDEAVCAACGDCVQRCQMDAITLDGALLTLDLNRCIGCGLCVTTCATGALRLERKPESEQRPVPKDMVRSTLSLGQARGKLGPRDLASMIVRSKADRIAARKD